MKHKIKLDFHELEALEAFLVNYIVSLDLKVVINYYRYNVLAKFLIALEVKRIKILFTSAIKTKKQPINISNLEAEAILVAFGANSIPPILYPALNALNYAIKSDNLLIKVLLNSKKNNFIVV